MIRNYIKIAWRNLRKNKLFSLINILGLAMGIAFILLAGAYVWSEWHVNADIKDNKRIYILQSKWKNPGMGFDFSTFGPLAGSLRENYPALVKDYYHLDGINSIVSRGEKHFSERLQVGDANFLSMFGFPLLYGDAGTALKDPGSIVITASNALKYFGRTAVIGETLSIQSFSGSKQDFKVTAILKDPPFNTVMSYGIGTDEFFLPASSLRFFGREAGFEQWNSPYYVSYILLQDGVKPGDLQKPIEQMLKSNEPEYVRNNLTVYLTSLKDYYLLSNNGIAGRMLYSISFTALFILTMAIINFINISIGNAVHRLREIGIRKVMGGTKKQLIIQFLTESVLFTAFSVIMALVLYSLTRQYFSNMTGRAIPALNLYPALYLFMPMSLILVIGFLAGIYPAFVLSAQRSVESLKGKLESVKEKVFFRYSLITLQFVTALVVFTVALFINRQVNFFFNSDLGYSKEEVITARVPRDWTPKGVQHMAALRDAFAALPEVSSASFSYEIPDGGNSGNIMLYKAGQDSSRGISTDALTTDEKFLETYAIPLEGGSFFNARGGSPDPTAIVLNETAVKALGWNNPQEAIGQKLRAQDRGILTIAGVAKDFHFGPFREGIRPEVFIPVQTGLIYRFLSFKLRPGNISASLAVLQRKWSSLLPEVPFDYHFMDDTLAKLYASELQMKKASQAATAIALVIVLLGVLGTVTQRIARREKEVGIRKVLGASVLQVLALFAREFSVIILLANCIAWPIGWIVVSKWLENYAYRVNLSLAAFLTVSLALMALVALLIAGKTLKTALTNPVKSLRSD